MRIKLIFKIKKNKRKMKRKKSRRRIGSKKQLPVLKRNTLTSYPTTLRR